MSDLLKLTIRVVAALSRTSIPEGRICAPESILSSNNSHIPEEERQVPSLNSKLAMEAENLFST